MSKEGYNIRIDSKLLSNLRLYYKLIHEKPGTGVSFNKFMEECLGSWWLGVGKKKVDKVLGKDVGAILESGERIHLRGEKEDLGERVTKEDML